MKKTFVLAILFVLPIVAYLFFLSGTTNFGKLAVLTENLQEVPPVNDTILLKNKITILGFLGSDINSKRANVLNLNQKIYKRFYEFDDLQFVMLATNGTETEVTELKKELSALADTKKWKFVYTDEKQIQGFFDGLRTNLKLDDSKATPYVFIIDKDLKLRGRDEDIAEKTKIKYGFNSESVAELNNEMVDDVKIILAEYRLALKKNNADRRK
ncbi:hypothetical protein [Maribacter sp. 2308TA10-17]|uniref:hypothetical protein n=1 Tax=Maribacter sp. 2308TA10-17 TaxID=3386276 RepID=UPI0039BC727D